MNKRNSLKKILTYNFLYDEYVNKKKSTAKIAFETNVNPESVRKYLHKFNIPLRDFATAANMVVNTGYGEILGSTWAQIKKVARRNQKEFLIDIKYGWELFLKQNRQCRYSGEELIFPKTAREELNGIRTASLDRIDSSKNYTKDNIQWIHKNLNWMKTNFDEKYFLYLCKTVHNFQSQNTNVIKLPYNNYIPKSYYNCIRAPFVSKGKEFTLSEEYINSLFIQQGGICKLSGIKLYVTEDSSRTICLDRINKKLGYIEGNVQWLHTDISKTKSVFSTEKYIEWCKRISNYENSI